MKWIGFIALGIGGIVLWALAGGIGKFAGRSLVQEYQQGKSEGVVEEALASAALQFRKQLPMRVDEITVLQSVASAGTLLVYNYSIELKKSEIDHYKFMKKMKNQLTHNVCGQKDMVFTLKHGGEYRYTYMGSDGITIGSVDIVRSDCVID